jgi:hypothetical protein
MTIALLAAMFADVSVNACTRAVSTPACSRRP